MWRARRMHMNANTWIFPDETACCARMIQVNMSEKDGVKVGYFQTVKRKLLFETRQGGGGTRINQRGAIRGTDQCSRDAAGVARPEEVNGVRRMHGIHHLKPTEY